MAQVDRLVVFDGQAEVECVSLDLNQKKCVFEVLAGGQGREEGFVLWVANSLLMMLLVVRKWRWSWMP